MTPVVNDRGVVVEQAAAATVVADAPDAVQQDTGDDSDALSSFLDAAEARLGRDTRVAAPGDTTDAAPANSKPSVAEEESDGGRDDDQGGGGADAGLDSGDDPEDDPGGLDFVDDDSDLDSGDDPDESVEDPGSDGEGAPIPAELQVQLDSEVGRFRAGRRDSGAADPSEIESEAVGPAGELASQAERGQSFLGQPSFEARGGGDSNFNPGADSSGAGAIDPGEDQNVPTGGTRNDDPFADTGTPLEPVTSVDSADAGAGSQSLLPSETSGPALGETPDVPDSIAEPA